VCAFLVVAAISVALGGASAHAAGPPPTLKIEVIGKGKVTGTGINCGVGSLTCYSSYVSASPSVTLTEAPAAGWTFSGWDDAALTACPALPAPTTCAVPVSGDTTATAIFTTTAAVQSETFGVALASSPTGTVANGSTNYPILCGTGGTDCSLTVVQGSTITVAEQPASSSFFFSGWGGSCGGTAVSCAVYVNGNDFVSANWVSTAPNTLTVMVSGSGAVTGGGISCGAGSTCDKQEPPNSTVGLTATPQSGYAFTGWGNACNGLQPSCTVQMDTDRTVTAEFDPLVPLSVTVSGLGQVSGGGITCGPGPQTCNAGEPPNSNVTLTAAPSTGASVFWSGCASSSGVTCTVAMATTPASVTVTFSGGTAPPVATFSLSVSALGDGYVTSSTGNIYCTAAGGSECTANVTGNTSLTLSAIPASGNAGDFTSWTGDCSAFTATTCTLTMNGAKTVGANFAGGNTTYLLTGQVVGNGSIAGAGLHCTSTGGSSCTSPQAASANVTLSASPGFGATFTGWSGGACAGSSFVCTVSMTTARSVTATFTTATTQTGERLTITVSGLGSVSASGGVCTSTSAKGTACTQEYGQGARATLVASAPAKGFVFAGWTGACTGKKTTCDVTMSAAEAVTAKFVHVFASTKRPTVKGHRVTLSFSAGESGKLTIVETRAGKKLAVRHIRVKAAAGKAVFTVARSGRYVFTATLVSHSGKHAVHWAVRVQ
jgi:uncharacterized repeat protein (TIGR02543 family)